MSIKYPIEEDRLFYNGKFWPKGVPHQLDYDFSMNLKDLLNQATKRFGDDPCIWFLDTFFTFKKIKNLVERFATALYKMGIRKGDIVAIHLPNCPQYVISYYAIASLGAISSGINSTYKSEEILHQVRPIKAKYIIVLDALYEGYYKKVISEWNFDKIIFTNVVDLAKDMSKIKKILGKLLKKIPTGKVNHPNAIDFRDCLNSKIELPDVHIDPEIDVATLIMTGGTTGIPKAAELTYENVVANAHQGAMFGTEQINPKREKKIGHLTANIGVLPLFHSFAMTAVMNLSFVVGAWMILFPKPPPAEEILKTVTSLPKLNGYIYCGAEILFQRIAELPQEILDKYDIADLICLSAAGPLHDYVRIPFEKKTHAKITELYGLTEATPGVSGNCLYGEDREAGYIGVPFPGTDWSIFPADDFNKGPIEEIGEKTGQEKSVFMVPK